MRNGNIHFEQVPVRMVEEGIAMGRIAELSSHAEGQFHAEPELFSAEGLTYPAWQAPVRDALLELDQEKLKERIMIAEAVIAGRLRSISRESFDPDERQALTDAMSSLRILKRDLRDDDQGAR